jgi:hypothetical protein
MKTSKSTNNSRISQVKNLEMLGFFRSATKLLKESEEDVTIESTEHQRLKNTILDKISKLFPLKGKSDGFSAFAMINIQLSRK